MRVDAHDSSKILFENLNSILNKDWKMNTRNFEIKTSTDELRNSLKELKLQKPPESFFGSPWIGDLVTLCWNTANTLGLAVLGFVNLKFWWERRPRQEPRRNEENIVILRESKGELESSNPQPHVDS